MTTDDGTTDRPTLTSGRTRIGAAAGLTIALLLGFLALAPTASAHHPDVSASVECGYLVHWTATSWAPDNTDGSGDNANVIVEYQLDGDGPWVEVPSGSPGSFDAPTAASFSGSFVAPGAPSSVTLRDRTPDPWGNGQPGGQVTETPRIDFPSDCVPPPDPSATAAVDCAEQEIVLSFTGVGSATTVDIRAGGALVAPAVPVPVGPSTATVAIDVWDENTDVTIELDYAAASATDQTLVVPIDCRTPAVPGAAITWECGSDVSIAMTNSGQESIDATISRNGAVVTTVAVPPGGTSTTISPTAENTTMEILVAFADDGTDSDVAASFTVDCDRPAPTIAAPVCQVDGGLDVSLGNVEGDDVATFTVIIDGEETTVTVAAGATEIINVRVAEDATVSLTITSGAVVFEDPELTRDCQQPVATIEFTCAAGGVTVTLTNSGSESATVLVDGELVVVPGGTTAEDPVVRVIPVAEDAAYDITVLGVTAEGIRDCEHPAIASTQVACADGGLAIDLTNDGDSDTVVTVDGVEVVVPAGTSDADPVRVLVPVEENADYDILVVGEGLEQRLTGTVDCLHPSPAVDDEVVCAKGGLRVVLRNTGEDTAVYTVSSPSLPDGDVTESLEAGAVESVFIPVAEDTSTTVTVVSDEEVLFDQAVNRNCESVLPNVVPSTTPDAGPGSNPLPRTGSDSSTLVAMAAILLLAGTGLVAATRRRRTTP